MKIVDPYARMLNPNFTEDMSKFTMNDGISMLRRIEYYARVSHASEDSITENSWDRFIRSVVMEHGDMSVIEHEKVTCEFLVDRGITHELVRHRIGSYTQESTRFINYKKKGGEAKFINPFHHDQPIEFAEWSTHCGASEDAYMALLERGVKPQIARGVLPNSLASKIIVTYNLRSWRHFFIMRTSAQAHPQMRQVTDGLLVNFQETIPILFEDITPGEQQSAAMKKIR